MKKTLLILSKLNMLWGSHLPYKIGDVLYIHHSKIYPGQIRISNFNVKNKIDQAFLKGGIIKHKELPENYIYKHFDGKSLMTLQEPLPVILSPEPYNIVLVDGHHELKAALDLNSQFIAIKVIDDLKDVASQDFWHIAFSKNYVYPFSIDGTFKIPPVSFDKLENDPNRFLAAILAKKINNNRISTDAKSGSYAANFPVWIKTGKPPFIEFILADLFRKHGLIYDDILYENDPPEEVVELARFILAKEDVSNKIKITGFEFIGQ